MRLVVGVGCSLGCSLAELAALVDDARERVPGEIAAVATVDRRAEEPCVVGLAESLGVPLLTFAADRLNAVAVPTPSAVVAAHVGTPSVAEAAALLAAHADALVVRKIRSPHATCAIAVRVSRDENGTFLHKAAEVGRSARGMAPTACSPRKEPQWPE
jgi:cobalt-precorrin 5A hydrolase/cobalt-precorrin 5A hydrolase/precorrin-3B C17-methyltransferase